MSSAAPSPSPRRDELLEAAYEHVLAHGLGDLTLRPLASAIGSSPRVLLYLFGDKDGLLRALLARARRDELEALASLDRKGLAATASAIWDWLSEPERRGLLALWVEVYARSLASAGPPWGGFARQTVEDWLRVLGDSQPAALRRTARGRAERTAALAVLRGAMLDLLATGDRRRTTAAVQAFLRSPAPTGTA
jgi:AcrR family transcriptional regulator